MSYAARYLKLAKRRSEEGRYASALKCAARGIGSLTDTDVATICQRFSEAGTAIAYLEALIAAEGNS